MLFIFDEVRMKRDDWILLLGFGFLSAVLLHRYFNGDPEGRPETMARTPSEDAMRAPALALLAKFDTNEDGAISATEYPGKASRFATMDVNQDEGITIEEMLFSVRTSFTGERPSCIRFVRKYDDNKDGLISEDELTDGQVKFNRADRNEDGVLHPIELCFTRTTSADGMNRKENKASGKSDARSGKRAKEKARITRVLEASGPNSHLPTEGEATQTPEDETDADQGRRRGKGARKKSQGNRGKNKRRSQPQEDGETSTEEAQGADMP